eukprot:TRINITY_DN54146_c0_g1_i1.p1 TRINITY_DN54146_c0_g1~~TRINITY_DN54146_c0_g1_i1.p1  ORF type:complete len:117 (-),score=13.39 TRINITY_DN54146_c0_g1_i1:1-351(-)
MNLPKWRLRASFGCLLLGCLRRSIRTQCWMRRHDASQRLSKLSNRALARTWLFGGYTGWEMHCQGHARPLALVAWWQWLLQPTQKAVHEPSCTCLLYTSDAADEEDSVDLVGGHFI